MGISVNALDNELEALISACRSELFLSGVDIDNNDYTDIIDVAIINYCKYQKNYQGLSEEYKKIYDSQKSFMMLACKRGL